MVAIQLDVDISKALAVLQKLHGPIMGTKLNAALGEVALFGERTVVGFTPVKTGALRASIKAQPMGLMTWKIVSPLDYAPIVEGGSRAHPILPHGKFLRFVVGGSVVFARKVRHPGTKAYQMFAKAVPQITNQLQSIIERHILS